MNTKFVKCEFCKTEITSDTCKFAMYRTVIDGQEHVFCCAQCAQRYQKRKQKK